MPVQHEDSANARSPIPSTSVTKTLSSSPSAQETRDPWPRDFGRDGVSGLVSADRALRARDVSRPSEADEEAAELVLADLLARVDGKRPPARRAGPTPPRSV